MEKYLGVKLINAEPMKESAFNLEQYGANYPKEILNDRDGYIVIYPDQYTSWSPKGVFEEAYRKINNLTWGIAIEALKMGKKVSRVEWNNNYSSIYLMKGTESQGILQYIEVNPLTDSLKIPNNHIFVGWVATHSDTFAEDWIIVE